MKKKHLFTIFLSLIVMCIILVVAYYYYSLFNKDNFKDTALSLSDVALFEYDDTTSFPAEKQYCLSCHQGIEPSRPLNSKMMKEILAMGEKLGDPNGCVVCHGGNPNEKFNKDVAHRGVPKGSLLKAFTNTPAALQVNENTCGLCHKDHTYNAHRSIMNTDAGKAKAITWSFGIGTENKDHAYGNYDIDDPDGAEPRFGTDAYKAYMRDMAAAHPGQYPSTLKQVPEVDLEQIGNMPHQAAFTYLRNCNACHLNNKGHQDRGHYRGMGCAACHSLYSNKGYYEGGDPSIDSIAPGHLLVHSMQGTRKSPVNLHGHKLSGIQVSTCAACHAAGRRIGHAYQGLMALGHSDNRGPFDEKGLPQKTNAGYVFKYIRNDAHHKLDKNGKSVTGLLCQDCHTTTAMHGNGNIGSTSLATVEIECADCHGIPSHYPWELPIGYGDEFHKTLDMSSARGTADEPLEVTKEFGITYPKEDGYILTSRANPMGNVVRKGNRVIVHSDSGYDFEVPTLKRLTEMDKWKNPVKAKTAMVAVEKHMEKLECYACHSTWVPQYYGYKYVIDYTKKSKDWLDFPNEKQQVGAPTYGDYSHTRWENPPLGVNGEGRVTPLVGVIQTVSTVIDNQGKTVQWNHVAQADAGYSAIELAPVNPHTTSLESRDCAECHGNTIAMGYGMDGGAYDSDPSKSKYADVVDANGDIVSKFSEAQLQAIKGLYGGFMEILSEDGKQIQTVDSHWPSSTPLTKEQREILSRGGTCVACHQDIPNGNIPIRMLGKIAEITNLSFASDNAHADLLRENNFLISLIKAFGIIAIILFIPFVILVIYKRKKIIKILKKLKNDK